MILKKLLFALLLLPAMISLQAQELKVMTYNIRFDNPADGVNAWPNRKAWLCEQIQNTDPDVFGIQEGLSSQVAYISQSFPGYSMIGVGRDDGKTKGEYSSFWYNNAKFKMLEHGTFWLSETPDKVSVGWDAALPRVCSYGLLKDKKTGSRLWIFNTHFDHMGQTARKNSALLIIDKVRSLNKDGHPVILMGDLNSEPESEPIRILKSVFQDARITAQTNPDEIDRTFNNFDANKPATDRIDYIFSGYGAKALNYTVIRELKEGRYASDHFPVIADIDYY